MVVSGLISFTMFPGFDLPTLEIVVRETGEAVSAVPAWASTAVNLMAGGLTAVLGGFAGAYLSELFAKRRRKADELASHKASAFTLQLQLMGMYTDLTQYREGLGQSRVASRAQQTGRLFRAQMHMAYSGAQAQTHFRVEELLALASYGSADLLNVVADLDRRFNTVVDAINQYRVGWLEVSATIEGDLQGQVVVMSLNEQEVRRLAPKFATLSKVLDDLDPIVEELVHDTYRALVGLYQARVKALGTKATFEAIAPDGKLVSIAPDPEAAPPKPKPLAEK